MPRTPRGHVICDLREKRPDVQIRGTSVRGKPLTCLSGRRNHFSRRYFRRALFVCRRKSRFDDYHDTNHTGELVIG